MGRKGDGEGHWIKGRQIIVGIFLRALRVEFIIGSRRTEKLQKPD